MTDIVIDTSEWGFTATLPNGVQIAHSKSRELLSEYVADCVRPEGHVPVHQGSDGPHAGSGSRDVGARGVPDAEPRRADKAPATGAPLSSISYTSRSRLTGATLSVGKAPNPSGWGVLCASHGSLAEAPSSSGGEKMFKTPELWCSGCAPIVQGTEPKIKKDALLEELL